MILCPKLLYFWRKCTKSSKIRPRGAVPPFKHHTKGLQIASHYVCLSPVFQGLTFNQSLLVSVQQTMHMTELTFPETPTLNNTYSNTSKILKLTPVKKVEYSKVLTQLPMNKHNMTINHDSLFDALSRSANM